MTVPRESDMRPEFRAHLEWQIASALRREERFAEPASRGAVSRLRTALSLVAALAVGAVAMAASGEVQESRQRDVLIEAARADEDLSRLRLQLAEAAYQEAKQKFDVGIASREAVQVARAQLDALKAALARIALNVEEIRATAQAPRDDLQAPLVGQRDFVAERLQLDLQAAQQGLAAAEQSVADAKKRFDVGLAPRTTQLDAEVDLAGALGRMQQLRTTLELRRRALDGQLKAAEVASALRRLELELERTRLERTTVAARTRLETVRRLVAVGQLGELELKRAELEVLEQERDLKRIREEIGKMSPVKR